MKKISLVLIGTFLSFICLEIFLQTTSFAIENIRKYNNYKQQKLSLRKKDKITILCIGESTTHRQYPIQLDKYLEKNSDKNFNIIDCGIPATSIKILFSKLDEQIRDYIPDIVISMMGINDSIKSNGEQIYNKYKLKSIELFLLIFKNLEHICFAEEKNILSFDEIYAKYVVSDKEPLEIFDFLKNNPNNKEAINCLIGIYFSRCESEKVYLTEKKYNIQQNITDYCDVMYFYLLRTYLSLKKTEDFFKLFNSMKANDSVTELNLNMLLSDILNLSDDDIIKCYYSLTNKQEKSFIVEKLYKYCLQRNLKIKKYNYKINLPNELIFADYVKNFYINFANKLIKNNITYICMSYPTMPIQQMKDLFINTSIKNRIIFVSNEKNFNNALTKQQYTDLFTDTFAGSFGHCTDLGNTMIAENVGKVILEITNNK
ncbi:MAG: hypothetical protein IKN42_08385 [Elusimicrobia bacterium]|nr:hypothetical protein [Elusimicrobiota bacterium]